MPAHDKSTIDMIAQRDSFKAFNSTFSVDAAYEFVQEVGQGAYGCVVEARHRTSGEGCAIKKVTNVTTKFILMKQCLREIKLLRHFRGHKNIICLYDMDIVFQPNGNFNEVYLYEELMQADLHAIIRSGQPLTDGHFQSFVYQTLCGLKYIHSANVLHRDIKPGNLLVNADCELKICDFGLARGYIPGGGGNQNRMTGYLANRWYRSPESLISFTNYTSVMDIWSLGCILAELLGGKPVFKGKDYVDQLGQILHHVGTPSDDTLSRVASPHAQDYIRSLPVQAGIPFTTSYPDANPLAIDLLTQMLCFDPAKRIGCEEALNHPYLQAWHDPVDEPVCEAKADCSFEEEDYEGVKKLIVEEVSSFREEVRAQARAAGQLRSHDNPPIPSRNDPMDSPVCEAMSSSTVPTHEPRIPGMAVDTIPNGSVHVVASGQTDTNSSLDFSVPNTLQNDLTDQITRDGLDPVASGGFADIYRGMLQENGGSTKVAIKAIKMYSAEDGDFAKKRKRLRREIKVWLDLRHDNVLPLLGTAIGFGRFPAMVCPWAENGTLTSYLEDRYDSLSVVDVLSLLSDVASGLHYLHSRSIVHGDLSGSNVLVRGDGKACIADFGLSTLLTELGASTFVTSFHARGTLRWTAPEMLDLELPEDGMEEESPRVAPTTQSDVYAFGSITLQILSGKMPYHYYVREAQVIHAVSRGITPRRPNVALVTERRWTFIERCWSSANSDDRPRPLSEEIVEFTRAELAGAGEL